MHNSLISVQFHFLHLLLVKTLPLKLFSHGVSFLFDKFVTDRIQFLLTSSNPRYNRSIILVDGSKDMSILPDINLILNISHSHEPGIYLA